jgi:hypothetical protein
MQRYTIFFITINALHASGRFSAHHQELKNCTHNIGYMSSLHAATASGSSMPSLTTLGDQKGIIMNHRKSKNLRLLILFTSFFCLLQR